MSSSVFYKSYEAPKLNEKEVLRYALCGEQSEEVSSLVKSCIEECLPHFSYKVCYSYFPVSVKEDSVDLGFAVVKSAALAKNLKNCSYIVLFAATVGVGADRLIAKYSRTQPARAHMLQAIGAERIESLCDAFCSEILIEAKERGFCTHPRFSPGYGDLDIEFQRQIFAQLNVNKTLGVSLGESLLMFPTKSVTAIIGLEKIKN